MATRNIKSTTWFDCLPTEILFLIFDYLSNNDILYTFFNLSQRLNNLLLKNQRYLSYLELPITNFETWKQILSVIDSQIECLNITTDDLSFSFRYFSNLKSLIISSPYELSNEDINEIIQTNQFHNLQSFKIKEDQVLFHGFYTTNSPEKDNLFELIFNYGNKLEKLILPTFHLNNINNLNINFNLHSIKLNFISFGMIFLLIKFTPNLEYLNVESFIPHTIEDQILTTNVINNKKLKEFYLTLHYKVGRLNDYRWQNSFDELIIGINQFSSSLICLSLNMIYLSLSDLNEIPFNSFKLQQFLEPMKQLKQFHLYAKLNRYFVDYEKFLSRFRNQFWFDHYWSFGMHQQYFYTLPFHFDSLYQFYEPLNDVKSNNPEILLKNPRIWFNVKSIQLEKTIKYDFNWIKQINIKMPKLNSIQFVPESFSSNDKSIELDLYKVDPKNKFYIGLNNVTTIRWAYESLENIKEWFIYGLPNLKHVILAYGKISSIIDNELINIFNKKIQRLDIDWYSDFEQLKEITYTYFSNVQYIYIGLSDAWSAPKQSADFIMKILKNFGNLKTLTIYRKHQHIFYKYLIGAEFDELISYLYMNEIIKSYRVKKLKNILSFQKIQCVN